MYKGSLFISNTRSGGPVAAGKFLSFFCCCRFGFKEITLASCVSFPETRDPAVILLIWEKGE